MALHYALEGAKTKKTVGKRMVRHVKELNCLSSEDKQKEREEQPATAFHSVMFSGGWRHHSSSAATRG
jgi:hypothetical protein